MIDQKIVIVFGLPGVGKSTLINQVLKKRDDFVRLSGGSLINKMLSEVERDTLRKQSARQILTNQEILIFNYQKEIQKFLNKHIIFDGHCVVKEGKEITRIPIDVIKRLKPDIIVFLNEPSEIIIERRIQDSVRPDRESETIYEIDSSRDLQLEICASYSAALNIPLKILMSPELEQMESLLNEFIKNE